MNSSEEFDSNPFNFQPLKRRKNPISKSQKVKRVKTTNPIPSQKPTYVQKTLDFRTEIEKPVEQQPGKIQIEGILVSLMRRRHYCLIFQCVLSARFLWIS